uniref:Neurotransmitter-gated ion-channel ligand-binding domain-containing protein n=1 Tax=Zooxanthella nutricula TaxID=1333877 RepID=A0A7S2HEW8_9DINO
MAPWGYEQTLGDSFTEAEEEAQAGFIHESNLTDSLTNEVCGHQGVGCDILWRTCQLVPDVPCRQRVWIDREKMDVLERVLTKEQHFGRGRPAVGIDISVQSVEAIDLVNLFWTGKVRLTVLAPAAVVAHSLSGEGGLGDAAREAMLEVSRASPSEEAMSRALELIHQDVETYRAGGNRTRHEFKPIPDMSPAEGLMRFVNIGVINWCRDPDSDVKYPLISGDTSFSWSKKDPCGMCLTATWTIESRWRNRPSLRAFPFDVNSLCAIFWVKSWNAVQIADLRRGNHGLGADFQEFNILDFRGSSEPLGGWRPYVCESNVVPNSSRRGEQVVYARFWVQRKAFFFITAVILPTAVLAYMGGAAILIAQGGAPNGIVGGSESPLSFLAGLMLTMMAMKFSYTDSLPKLGYLTMLDWYILGSFTMLWVAALLVMSFTEEELSAFDASRVYSCGCSALNVAYFCMAFYLHRVHIERTPRLSFTAGHTSVAPK